MPFSSPLKYNRPSTLSDPYCDYPRNSLDELIATPDTELNWYSFKILLGPFTPAGTYAETVYFLPFAFDYILDHDSEALDLCTSLVWFASEFSEELRRDKARDWARNSILACLSHWSQDFVVDAEQLVEKHSEVVCETLCDLVRFKAHSDLAIEFVHSLAYSKDEPTRSAWFLELARSHFEKSAYRVPKLEKLVLYFQNKELASRHIELAEKTFDMSTPYWQNTMWLLVSNWYT